MTYPYIRAVDRKLHAEPSRGGGDIVPREVFESENPDWFVASYSIDDKGNIERVSKGRLAVRGENIVPTGA